MNCSYSNKENTFSGRKIPLIHLLLTLCHHKHTYSLTCVHKIGMCENRALCALDAFNGVKTFCWLLAPNTTFHKKHCLNLPRAGSSFSHRGKSSFNSVPFLHGPFWKTILLAYIWSDLLGRKGRKRRSAHGLQTRNLLGKGVAEACGIGAAEKVPL